MSQPLSVALSIARTYLNDDNAIQFPDAVLIPKMQEAHRELQEALWVCGSPIVRTQSAVIAVGASATVSVITTPADFLCPMTIQENATGQTIYNTGWQLMTEAFYIPVGYQATGVLGYWQWQEETLTVAPCTAARTIVMTYRRQITIPQVNTDLIGVLFGESYLGARGGAIAAGTLGNQPVLDALTQIAKANLANVIKANRGQQMPAMVP